MYSLYWYVYNKNNDSDPVSKGYWVRLNVCLIDFEHLANCGINSLKIFVVYLRNILSLF